MYEIKTNDNAEDKNHSTGSRMNYYTYIHFTFSSVLSPHRAFIKICDICINDITNEPMSVLSEEALRNHITHSLSAVTQFIPKNICVFVSGFKSI